MSEQTPQGGERRRRREEERLRRLAQEAAAGDPAGQQTRAPASSEPAPAEERSGPAVTPPRPAPATPVPTGRRANRRAAVPEGDPAGPTGADPSTHPLAVVAPPRAVDEAGARSRVPSRRELRERAQAAAEAAATAGTPGPSAHPPVREQAPAREPAPAPAPAPNASARPLSRRELRAAATGDPAPAARPAPQVQPPAATGGIRQVRPDGALGGVRPAPPVPSRATLAPVVGTPAREVLTPQARAAAIRAQAARAQAEREEAARSGAERAFVQRAAQRAEQGVQQAEQDARRAAQQAAPPVDRAPTGRSAAEASPRQAPEPDAGRGAGDRPAPQQGSRTAATGPAGETSGAARATLAHPEWVAQLIEAPGQRVDPEAPGPVPQQPSRVGPRATSEDEPQVRPWVTAPSVPGGPAAATPAGAEPAPAASDLGPGSAGDGAPATAQPGRGLRVGQTFGSMTLPRTEQAATRPPWAPPFGAPVADPVAPTAPGTAPGSRTSAPDAPRWAAGAPLTAWSPTPIPEAGRSAGPEVGGRPAIDDRGESPVADASSPPPDPAHPVRPHPYSWLHLIALIVVAFVLGMLIFMVVMQDPPEAPAVEPTGQALVVDPSTHTRPTGE